jgi:hypothetical protein
MEDELPRIYADANDQDSDGRFMLDIPGSLRDIQRYGDRLTPGMRVIFNVQEELEVEGTLEIDATHGIWLGRPDYRTLRHL